VRLVKRPQAVAVTSSASSAGTERARGGLAWVRCAWATAVARGGMGVLGKCGGAGTTSGTDKIMVARC
jgi:hypothetical protein